MTKFIAVLVLALVIAQLLVPFAANQLNIIIVSLVLMIGGIIWLVTRKLPKNFIPILLTLSFLPGVVVMILNLVLTILRRTDNPAIGGLILLALMVAAAFLAQRLLRRSRRSR